MGGALGSFSGCMPWTTCSENVLEDLDLGGWRGLLGLGLPLHSVGQSGVVWMADPGFAMG